MLRKTRILVTIGPATEDFDTLCRLIRAGANVFRLNMSHGKHDWVREVVANIQRASEETGMGVATLMDLQGPSIRTGVLENPIPLTPGDKLEIINQDARPEMDSWTTTNYPGLVHDVKAGDTVMVDNGVIHLRILEKRKDRLICEALTEGELTSRRHINLPGVRVNLPGLTTKDESDLAVAAELDLDYVSLSFVRSGEQIQLLRSLMEERDYVARIVAKIEDQEAVRNLDGIIKAADAVMVARGDLGIEVSIEELPAIQRSICRRCAELGRKVIVATHMLESMIENPVPTRAEVTDVANAVFEQADAIMLSGETSIGAYPVKAVETFARIATRMEREPGADFCHNAILKTAKQKTVKSAVSLADSLEDSAILVFTKRGVMANYVAHLRPKDALIFAFTPDAKVKRALHMNRGVYPFQMEFGDDSANVVERALTLLRDNGMVKEGSPVVILSDVLSGEFVVDSILLRKA